MNTFTLNLNQNVLTCGAIFDKYINFLFGDEDETIQKEKHNILNVIYGDKLKITDVDNTSNNYYLKFFENTLPFHIVICPNYEYLMNSLFAKRFGATIKTGLHPFIKGKEKILICMKFIFV